MKPVVVASGGAAISWATFAALALSLATPATAHAKTVTVGGGCTLPAAVNAVNNEVAGSGCAFTDMAEPAYLILVPAQAFPGGTLTLSTPLELRRSVTIRGSGDRPTLGAAITTSHWFFRVVDATNTGSVVVTFDNLNIERQSGNFDVTGIHAIGAVVTVYNSRVAGFGLSGIISDDSTLSISSSVIVSNWSFSPGGGVQFNNPSFQTRLTSLDIDGCWIGNNIAADGGGVYSSDGNSSIRNSLIVNNQAFASGGGVFTSDLHPEDGASSITDSSIVGNQASTGGGIARWGALVISGCQVRDNHANATGGGIYVGPAGPTNGEIEQCTVASNSANDGGGIAVDGGPSVDSAALVDISQSLIADNSAELSGGGIWSTGQIGVGSGSNTIYRNAASTGGGIFVQTSGEFDMNRSTIASNSATSTTGVGGVEVRNAGTSAFYFNLIANNGIQIPTDEPGLPPDLPPVQSDVTWLQGSPSVSYNLIGFGTDALCSRFPWESGNIVGGCHFEATDDDGQPLVGQYSNPLDPRLAADLQDLGGRTEVLAICPDSPAIDKILEGGTTYDQRGEGRRMPNADHDIGAFELGPSDLAFVMCTDPVAQYGSSELIDLGVLHAGAHLMATGINSFGDVSAVEMTPTSSVAWRFDAATEAWSQIQPSPADAAAYNGWYPTGIDDEGVVVGSSGWHGEGFLASRGALAQIVTGRHGYADVSDVNPQGQLAGSEPVYVNNAYAGYIAAFRRDQEGSMHHAGLPTGTTLGGGTLVGYTYGLGIAPQPNPSEENVDIVGYAALYEGERTFANGMVFRPGWGMREAYRFTGTYAGESGMQNLNDDAAPNGWQLLYMAQATNGTDIVGWGVHNDRCRAFRYRIASKHVTDLGSLEQTHPGADLCDYGEPGRLLYYYPTAITATGAIVGSIAYGGAFYYSDGTGMMDLQLLVDSSLGITLDNALDMNESGEIVGSMHVPNDSRAHAYKLVLPAGWL